MAEDQRRSVRKILKVKANLVMAGESAISVRTMDVNVQGLSLMLPSPLALGEQGQVSFSMYFNGKHYTITAEVRVAYCILVEGGFKTGFFFTVIEPDSVTAISLFSGTGVASAVERG